MHSDATNGDTHCDICLQIFIEDKGKFFYDTIKLKNLLHVHIFAMVGRVRPPVRPTFLELLKLRVF